MPGEFIGRHRQLAIVGDAVDRLARGHGCSIVVTGEAGIGKSRFAREIAVTAEGRDVEVMWAAGWPAGGAPAYWPWPQILADLDPTSATPFGVVASKPDSERFDRFREVGDVVWRRHARGPLMIVIDDAHAIDADALLLTRFVAQGTAGHPVLLLLLQRTGPEVSPATVDLLGEIARAGMTVRLDELTAEEVAHFIEDHGERTNEGVVQRVSELTGGVPFLVEQVLDAGLHLGPGPLPAPARRLAEARLAGLDPDQRAVIEAAAVLGVPLASSELATITEADTGSVLEACQQAEIIGLFRKKGLSGFAFKHDLVREAIVSSLPPAKLAVLHHRCLEMLEDLPRSPERANRRARHALERARLSDDLIADSIAIVRESAGVLRAHGSPAVAAELLEASVELHEHEPQEQMGPVLVELGGALLATGHLRASREVFRRALEAVSDASDPTVLAQAALGLGGVWVLEYRTADAWQNYLDVLQRAIDAMARDPSSEGAALRAGLRLRLTAERAAVGAADIDDVFSAFDAVRTDGTPREVLAGLSALHHLMLGPDNAHERIAVADELVDLARAVGDDLHLAMGLLWRAVDEILLGRDADRRIEALRARVDALEMRAITFVVDASAVMRQLRDGDLAAAEEAARACHALGVEVGDVDADNYLAAQLLAIHWYRGTATELLGLARDMVLSPASPSGNPVFTAAVAAIAAAAGEVDVAERALDHLGCDRIDEIPSGSTWLATMFCIVEAASDLHDVDLAAAAYDLIRPYEALPMMAAVGVTCFGSTARSLGIAARTVGRLDDAVAHLERAVEANQRLGNRPMTTIARADLATTLLSRRQPGDLVRASTLIARAIEGAIDLGLTGRIEPMREVQRSIDDETAARRRGTLERRNGAWRITAGDEEAGLASSAGLGYLARLLAAPGVDIAVGALVGLEVVSPPQELLDASTRASVSRRIANLESTIDSAILRNDTAKAGALQAELDTLMTYLRSAMGPSGPRSFDDANERARTSVQKAVRRAIIAIGRDCPELSAALERSIKTGYRCRYEPTDGAPARWDVLLD